MANDGATMPVAPPTVMHPELQQFVNHILTLDYCAVGTLKFSE